jgi:hypothetical protein
MHKLLCHLRAQHLNQDTVSTEPEFSTAELAGIHIQHNTIFSHATTRFNYTTYDVRRDHDVINCNTALCDVMLRVLT